MFLQPLGADLDKFALLFIAADRYNPGTHDGVPVAIAQSVKLTMHACLEEEQDETGKKSDSWRLSFWRRKNFRRYPIHLKMPS